MKDDAVREFLTKANAEWEVIENVVNENKLVEGNYENKVFYIRKLAY
jgi:hypothetical protein